VGDISPLDAKLARTFNFLPSAGEYFCSLYRRREKFICKLPGQDSWRTWTGPLLDYQILGVIADCGRGLLRGCHWGDETRFAVLDIDAGSKYHTADELQELTAAIAAVGLRLNLYRSSETGGWHCYIPFTKWEKSGQVEETLRRWLKRLGYEIKGGQLEIFPSGNALRLPLQPGFAWLDLDGNLLRRREELRLEDALTEFLTDLETNSEIWEEAKERIESQITSCQLVPKPAAGGDAQEHEERLKIEGFEHLFSRGCIKSVWEKGRKFWQEGLQKSGQRHEAILCVGHYLWYGDEEHGLTALPGGRNDEYRAELIEQWLKDKHNGFCNHIRRGDWDRVREDVQRAVVWRKRIEKVREPYPLTSRLLKRLVGIYKKTGRIWSIPQFEKANQDRKIDARERIAQAIRELKEEGQLITAAEIARRAKADWRTVKKNWDLMALVVLPSEAKLLETETNFDPLARSGCVYSPGGLAPSSVLVHFSPCGSVQEKKEKEFLESFRESEIQLAVPAPHEVPLPTPPPLRFFSGPRLESRDRASSEELAPIYETPPLLSCLAGEPTTCTQNQDRALRVPTTEVLTLGPMLRGIQAVLQEGAGGLGQSSKWQRDSGVNSGLLLAFGTFRYGNRHLYSDGWTENAVLTGCLQIGRYGLQPAINARIPRVVAISGDRLGVAPLCVEQVPTRNRKAGGLFTFYHHGNVRGPPKRIRAW